VTAHDYARAPLALATGQAHRVKLPPCVMRGRLTGFLFDTNKAFLLPGSLSGIRGLATLYAANPGVKVLVTGHTDTVGPDAANLALSVDRARAVAAFLGDDIADWLAFYRGTSASATWGTREDQHMLTALPDGQPPYLAGPATGVLDGPTQAAVKRFQADHGLAVDGIPGDATRRALVTDYMAIAGTSLPAGTEIQTHGCGEHHNAVPTPDDTPEQENRRVEVFLFEGPIAPPPQPKCPRPGCAEYAVWVEQTSLTIDLDSPLTEAIRILFVDRDNRPLAQLPCELCIDGAVVFSSRTDNNGFAVTSPLPPATTCVARWTDRSDAADGEYMYRAELRLAFSAGDAGVAERLDNLGYRSPPALRDAVLAYQRDNGLPQTGVAADIGADLLTTHDQHAPRPRPAPTEVLVMTQNNGP
jgi:outer membrane protein OmpA-like peptidoglycan-associated protein